MSRTGDEALASARRSVAVVGLACRYPGARGLPEFWENILGRRQQFRRIPDVRLPRSEYYDSDVSAPEKTYGGRAAVIDGFEFDWKKRFVPKRVYETADVVHWLALETALDVLADAGLARETIQRDRSGVILGNTLTGEETRANAMRQRWPFVRKALLAATRARGLSPSLSDDLAETMRDYFQSVFPETTEDTLSGGLSNTIAGRICNYLDLHGGGYTVDGACASSLLAIAAAATALVDGELDFALAGGVDVSLDTFELIGFAKTGALTPTDMRVYDRRADGFIPGEGCGFVALKRLEDARAAGDRIYAVLRGWGISSDGKGGLTAPSREGQATALGRAYRRAGYAPDCVDFFEGHGTGTSVGDRTELEGIALAIGEGKPSVLRPHGVTSLKSIVGHTKAAAGVGGFIKAALAVHRRVLPPSAGCVDPNPVFQEQARNLYPILSGETRGKDSVLRAGVSAMGFGGINCHATLESGDPPGEWPGLDERAMMAHAQDAELFIFSADSRESLAQSVAQGKALAAGISVAELADLAARLGSSTVPRAWRAAAIAGSPDELIDRLAELEWTLEKGSETDAGALSNAARNVWFGLAARSPRVAFVFPGQGSQQLLMARSLVERHAWARALMAKAERWVDEVGGAPIANAMFPPLDRRSDLPQQRAWEAELARTEVAQPAICLASLLWRRFLAQLGVTAEIVAGHSLGELSAFAAAGAVDDEQLIKIAALRGLAMAAPSANAGGMASLSCDAETAQDLIARNPGYLTIANLNAPRQTVVSGDSDAIDAVVSLARSSGMTAKRLPVSNAFHSRYVAEAVARLRDSETVPCAARASSARVVSGLDGREVGESVQLREHVARQVSAPVRFIDVARRLDAEADLIFEVGPGQVLSGLIRETTGRDKCLPVAGRPDSCRDLLVALARAFCEGLDVAWAELYRDRLIRDFTPTADKLFIVNPCERPFTPSRQWRSAPAGDVPAALSAISPVGADELQTYLSRRGKFLAAVIRADLEVADHTRDPTEGERNSAAAPSRPSGDSVRPYDAEPASAALSQGVEHVPVPALLVQLAAQATGFPRDSIVEDMRLLDHLNLDSIKAGELVAAAAQSVGVAGTIDATAYANATLAEIAEALSSASIVASRADATDPAGEPLPRASNWVRFFRVESAPEPLTGDREIDLSGADALLVADAESESFADAIAAFLTRAGAASVLRRSFEAARAERSFADLRFTHRIALLPARPPRLFSLADCVSRLQLIADLPRSRAGAATVLAIVQFGGGALGLGPAPGLDEAGAAAFAASLHLERPELKVRLLDADGEADPSALAQRLAQEFGGKDAFVRAAYDREGTRRVSRPRLEESASWPSRGLVWTSDDVALVTGGARGITAECALAFALSTGVRLALVGASAPSEASEAALERVANAGVAARYYRCDVTDADEVARLVFRVRADLGSIAAVIHGAALNAPRRVDQVSVGEALAEVGPKVQGALNLLTALKDRPPKLIVGFSSIIGVTGMAGNAWYAWSNEALALILHKYRRQNPGVHVVCAAFSAWSEVGMGARLASASKLSGLGVGLIAPREGARRFMQLIERDPGSSEIIVTSSLGGLDTWIAPRPRKPTATRYLDETVAFEPSVELRVRTRLTKDRDPYVMDHVHKGSPLFPAVFGLEAMAEAALWVTGRQTISELVIEDIRLEKPIVVDPSEGAVIELYARVRERDGSTVGQRVDVSIATETSGFASPHFAAAFVFDQPETLLSAPPALPADPIDLEPDPDLYGWLLFQGPRFRRLRAIHALDAHVCVASAEGRDGAGSSESEPFLLGDPYLRDAALQAAQLTVPQHLCLPIRIARIALKTAGRSAARRLIMAAFDGFAEDDNRHLLAHVEVFDAEGGLVERIDGCRLAVTEHRPDHPTPDDIAAPDQFDTSRLREVLARGASQFGLLVPELALAHVRLHGLERDTRRSAARAHVERALGGAGVAGATVEWEADGRPRLAGRPDLGISISHDDRALLVAAAHGPQGCDLMPIAHRAEDDWSALLGGARLSLLRSLVSGGDELDVAGSRIWAALEAVRKAAARPNLDLSIRTRAGEAVVFDCRQDDRRTLKILTTPWRGLRGPRRMVAIVVGDEVLSAEAGAAGARSADLSAFGAALCKAPTGQPAFRLSFPLTFRDASPFSGRLRFTRFFDWMGQLREAASRPVYRELVDRFSTGRWGMVTNASETRIFGEVGADEIVEGRVWLDNPVGAQPSRMDLGYEWTAHRADGRSEIVAESAMSASWVEILDSGVAARRPFPDPLLDFMKTLAEGRAAGARWDMRPRVDLGAVLSEAPQAPVPRAFLEVARFETSLQESNLVGNIYFANYFDWQARVFERYCRAILPQAFDPKAPEGEFFCACARVEHLREAMPFDVIVVKMSLAAACEHGLRLRFDYYREKPDGAEEKLASGEQDAIWTERDLAGGWQTTRLPKRMLQSLREAISPSGQKRAAARAIPG